VKIETSDILAITPIISYMPLIDFAEAAKTCLEIKKYKHLGVLVLPSHFVVGSFSLLDQETQIELLKESIGRISRIYLDSAQVHVSTLFYHGMILTAELFLSLFIYFLFIYFFFFLSFALSLFGSFFFCICYVFIIYLCIYLFIYLFIYLPFYVIDVYFSGCLLLQYANRIFDKALKSKTSTISQDSVREANSYYCEAADTFMKIINSARDTAAPSESLATARTTAYDFV
jgi:hypothetical protein